jgi:ferredoxin-NADP reductase
VKRLDDGRGGSRAMWQLAAGDRLQLSGPHNHFPLDLGAPAYLLVAGGIGITPLLGMAQVLAGRCLQLGRPLRMLYGVRSEAELAYGETLHACLGERLHAAIATQLDFAAEIAALPPGAQMYVCGPVPMLDAARRAWEASGRPATDLRYETFGNSGRLAPQAFRVRIPRHWISPCRPTAACWTRWSWRAWRRCPTASAANAACAHWTCWRWTARSTTATCF